MMVNSRTGTLLDLKQAAPQRRFDAELRRNGRPAFRARRLQSTLVEFERVNNTDCGGSAHRFIRVIARKLAIHIAASPTTLAVWSATLYPTLVDVRRALVGRTETLVCAKRRPACAAI